MDKSPIESKKWTSTAMGIGAILIAGTGAVAFGGALGISALPYVIGGIVALTGGHVVSQGVQDAILASKKDDDDKVQTTATPNKDVVAGS